MKKIAHITDPHLNFLGKTINPRYARQEQSFRSSYAFGAHLAKTLPDVDALVVTGDCAEADSVERCMKGLVRGWKKPIYFVFGNHDIYRGSFESVFKDAKRWAIDDLIWLRTAGVVKIAPDVALCGNEGWYDGRAGDALKSQLYLSDFEEIQDFRGSHIRTILEDIQALAVTWALEAMVSLREACAAHKQVFFATHVPPFREAAWHEGEPSSSHWAPWMVNVTLGQHLLQVAEEFPGTAITVLCGHTHSPGEFQALPNLKILTGKSEYWWPQVSNILELDNLFQT